MRLAFFAPLAFVAATAVQAASIPANLEFPHVNGATPTAVFKMADHPNGVFVFEALSITCSDCTGNVRNVNDMVLEYKDRRRVQFLDMSVDESDSYAREWVRRFKPSHPVIKDVGRRVYDALKTESSIPQAFVVNCRGEMVGNWVDAWTSEGKAHIRDLIQTALQTECQ